MREGTGCPNTANAGNLRGMRHIGSPSLAHTMNTTSRPRTLHTAVHVCRMSMRMRTGAVTIGVRAAFGSISSECSCHRFVPRVRKQQETEQQHHQLTLPSSGMAGTYSSQKKKWNGWLKKKGHLFFASPAAPRGPLVGCVEARQLHQSRNGSLVSCFAFGCG